MSLCRGMLGRSTTGRAEAIPSWVSPVSRELSPVNRCLAEAHVHSTMVRGEETFQPEIQLRHVDIGAVVATDGFENKTNRHGPSVHKFSSPHRWGKMFFSSQLRDRNLAHPRGLLHSCGSAGPNYLQIYER